MEGKMATTTDPKSLNHHVDAVKKGTRTFEDAFQGVSRMILDAGIHKVTVKGKTTYQFDLFSRGKKHLVGMYDEINSFVSFVKDASEGGSSREMAFVLVGEPGNGKTFFVEYLCARYREFLSTPKNMKYTFRFKNLDRIGGYVITSYSIHYTKLYELMFFFLGCSRLISRTHQLSHLQ